MNQNDRDIRVKEFLERRKKIMAEWKVQHPEGFTAANLEEAKKFFKNREKEIKKAERQAGRFLGRQ